MKWIATVYYWLVFTTTASFGLGLVFLINLFSRFVDPQRRFPHWFISHWAFQYTRIWPGWSSRVLHRERIPKGPCVLVTNHQSMSDVIALMGLYSQFKFVSKKSLFSMPIVGWALKLGHHVALERGKVHSTQKMLDDCRGWLRQGMAVLIFPEGTYSGGDRLLPFKKGAFLLAREEKVPLVPVILRGTNDLIFEDGPMMGARARIELEVLEPFAPGALGDDDDAAAAKVRALFAEKLGRPL